MDTETGWDLTVGRADLADAVLATGVPVPQPTPGEAVLRVSRVGMTANNVTYAVLGDSMRYWQFFPAPAGRGHVPLWGYADVVASTVAGVPVGARFYGYLPSASHLVVTPARVGPTGFRDGVAHRAELPSPYQAYLRADGLAAAEEDLETLYRPLFTTSWMLADQLGELPVERVVLSSASSKTAYGTAHLLHGSPGRSRGPRVVGLTSERNRGFVEGLGVYDEVRGYGDLAGLAGAGLPTAYVDLSGDPALRVAVRAALGADLAADLIVGVTNHAAADPSLRVEGERDSGPRPALFFAPDRIAARHAEWGRAGYEERLATAWATFAEAVGAWVTVVPGAGPEALRRAWLDVLGGGSDPATGLVVSL